MRKMQKMWMFVLVMMLLVSMSVPANADILSSGKVTSTIDSQLQSLMNDVSAEERFPVDIWLYETTTIEEREQEIYLKIGLSKMQITSDSKGVISSKRIDEYIETERAIYAEERVRQYASIQQDYAKVQGLQDTRKSGTRLFFSQYAPMISAELTPAEIKMLARDSRVQSIYYSPNATLKDEGNFSIPTIGADYTRDTLGYSGSGVKIGMIETSIPEKTKNYFDLDKIYYDESLENIPADRNHANTVAAIMVGQETTIGGVTYKGIVPDAELYVTCCTENNGADWRLRVEWLISQGVHVINMSAYLTNQMHGHYGANERWTDHIVSTHNVHFVKSAGNLGTRVTSPGTAYNILTVGAINDNNTLQHSDDTPYNVDSFSTSYMEDEDIANKPDLMAPGVGIYTPAYVEGVDSGTSFATPHVTGVVAQLCHRFPSLRVLQAGVKAILTASVCHSKYAYNTVFMDSEDVDNYDKFGAGVVSATAAFETANAYRMMVGNFPANTLANTERVYSFTASAGQRVRVSLTWLHNAIIPNNETHESYELSDYVLDDLDLYVIHPEGADIHLSLSTYNNTEIIDFVAPTSGTYQMVVINRLATEQVVSYGLSWWFGAIVDSD